MFTEFDVLVWIIMCMAIVSSFMRGAIRDILSVLTYLGAAFLTLFFFPYAATITDELFKDSMIVNMAAVVFVFVLSLALIALFTAALFGGAKEWRGTIVDRILGLFFGLFKGLVIVSVLHFSIVEMSGEEPDWLAEGQTYDFTHAGSEHIRDIFYGIVDTGEEAVEEGEEFIEEGQEFIEEQIH